MALCFVIPRRWLSCLYSATQIDTISDTTDDLKSVLRLALNLLHMSLMR